MKAQRARRISTLIGRAIEWEVNALVLGVAFKALTYGYFTSQPCDGRPLHAYWKTVQFCVTSLQLLLWNSTDYTLLGILVMIITSAIAAFFLSKFWLDGSAP